ncbi:hypothetical protein ACFSUD_03665 [Sulfitobacter aestuarii]|uniref:LysR substrate-binding domain-containing protein n=1 Tax=Sulfitobacter aestuarii TaxID=2161676 RepID=A0ABW5U057_9RHOB
MGRSTISSKLRWDRAAGLSSLADHAEALPQGALVPDTLHDCDQVAVVYAKGHCPPEITICSLSRSVHQVLADGIAVAVIARAGPAPCVEDVLLVERSF